MLPIRRLAPDDPAYPRRLLALRSPPTLTYASAHEGLACGRAIGIVGSRLAHAEAAEFARRLAAAVARAGAVVLSGGALGIDAAAHRGALDGGGRTWVLCPTGRNHTYPAAHAPLFERIVEGGGALVWPFGDDTRPLRCHFRTRNGVLAALSDALVVVQAGVPSGALNAAAWARRLNVPLFVVSPPAWEHERFRGSALLIQQGAKVVLSLEQFLEGVGLSRPAPQAAPRGSSPLERARTTVERALILAASNEPKHVDVLLDSAHISPQDAASALLTLALENVLVEGPAGFFRLGNPA